MNLWNGLCPWLWIGANDVLEVLWRTKKLIAGVEGLEFADDWIVKAPHDSKALSAVEALMKFQSCLPDPESIVVWAVVAATPA